MLDKNIIYEYIKRIKKEDIFNYGIKEKISLTSEEVDIIYDYITNRYDDIINNPLSVLLEVKNNIRKETYNKLLVLYDKYKLLLKKRIK